MACSDKMNANYPN